MKNWKGSNNVRVMGNQSDFGDSFKIKKKKAQTIKEIEIVAFL